MFRDQLDGIQYRRGEKPQGHERRHNMLKIANKHIQAGQKQTQGQGEQIYQAKHEQRRNKQVVILS